MGYGERVLEGRGQGVIDSVIPRLTGQTGTVRLGVHEYEGRQRNHVECYILVWEEFKRLLIAFWKAWESDNPCPGAANGEPCIHDWLFHASLAAKRFKLNPEWA
jgi:hypothetical protein